MFGKQQFIGKVDGAISEKYTPIKVKLKRNILILFLSFQEIGSGSYGKVYKVKNNISGEFRACKQLTKTKIADMKKFKLEIMLMIQIDHPNVIKLYEIFEDSRYIYLIMEECEGGELFERIFQRINEKNLYSEKEAAIIFRQMMNAICHCHSLNICHRDLKPENLMFLNSSNDCLKVIDFGLSRIFDEKNNIMKSKVIKNEITYQYKNLRNKQQSGKNH